MEQAPPTTLDDPKQRHLRASIVALYTLGRFVFDRSLAWQGLEGCLKVPNGLVR